MKKLFIALMAISSLSTSAFAKGSGGGSGVYLGLGFYYGSTKEKATTPASAVTDLTTSPMQLNGKIGYIFPNGLYLGGIYANDSVNTTTVSAGTTTKIAETIGGYGASVGFMKSNMYVMAHYLTGFTDKTTTTIGAAASTFTQEASGSGYQLDLGFMLPMSGTFALGAELDLRSLTYTGFTSTSTTTSVTTDFATSDTYPKIVMSFMF